MLETSEFPNRRARVVAILAVRPPSNEALRAVPAVLREMFGLRDQPHHPAQHGRGAARKAASELKMKKQDPVLPIESPLFVICSDNKGGYARL